jgi:hypothetical protein
MGQRQRLLRRWLGQGLLYMGAMSGLFSLARLLTEPLSEWWSDVPAWPLLAASGLWFVALALALPLLTAVAGKLKAAAILFAEGHVPEEGDGIRTSARRASLAGKLLIVGFLVLAVWIIALTVVLWPPWPLWPILPISLASAAWDNWRGYREFYGRADFAAVK